MDDLALSRTTGALEVIIMCTHYTRVPCILENLDPAAVLFTFHTATST